MSSEETQRRSRRETFILYDEHVEILEDMIYVIRKKSGFKLNKSQMIRTLIRSLAHKNIEFEKITSVESFYNQILK